MQTWLPQVRKSSAGKSLAISKCWDLVLEEMELQGTMCLSGTLPPQEKLPIWNKWLQQPYVHSLKADLFGSILSLLQIGCVPPNTHETGLEIIIES